MWNFALVKLYFWGPYLAIILVVMCDSKFTGRFLERTV